MLKIAIASLFTKNKVYAAASKIQGYMGAQWDGTLPYGDIYS